MNNFRGIFEELSKIYEEADQVNSPDQEETETQQAPNKKDVAQVEDACTKKLTEDTDVSEEEAPEEDDEETEPADDEEVEIEITDDEPRQIICECDKCGALVIKDEADIVVDEETDLVNVEDECQFCEETAGYKIIGIVAPYDETVGAEVPTEYDNTIEEALPDIP